MQRDLCDGLLARLRLSAPKMTGPDTCRRPRTASVTRGTSARRRVAVAFVVGTLVPVATLLVVLPLAGAAGVFIGSSVGRPFAMLGVACVAGGQFAGGALRRGRRSRVAFGVAFPIGLAMPLVVVSGLGALSGHETVTDLAVRFVPVFALAYGLLGAVGGTLSAEGWRGTAQVAGAFTGGGVVGGVTLTAVVALVASSSGAAAAVARTCGAVVACVIPAAVGGWRLARPHLTPPRRPSPPPR